uniref:Voltage-dependent calcium channel alpha-2/delta subunit conserved region domain-containing protein n=1 Tax=Calidris pygmaea TaxID=425635 RepID=A0A8C3JM11_9CHAR
MRTWVNSLLCQNTFVPQLYQLTFVVIRAGLLSKSRHSLLPTKHDTLQPCDTEYPVFVYEPAIKETNGLIECGDCQKMFVAQQIASSNLLLLVMDATCDCSVFPPVLLDVKEVKYILPLKCERMRSQKLRRRPDTCHAFHPEVPQAHGHQTNPFLGPRWSFLLTLCYRHCCPIQSTSLMKTG